MSSTLYSQLADALRENAVNREAIEAQNALIESQNALSLRQSEAIEAQDALILHQSDEITQLHAQVAEQADYISTLEQHVVEAQRDLADTQREVYQQWLQDPRNHVTQAECDAMNAAHGLPPETQP